MGVLANVGIASDREADRLVLHWKAGDASAFGELYAHYFDSVYAYARLMVRDTHQAEDVAQEVFAKAMRSRDSFEIRPGDPFRAWLFRIARNTVIDTLRSADRVRAGDPALILRLQEARGWSEALPGSQWRNDSEVAILMRRLPAAQRDVLYMRCVLEMSYEDIGTVMERTPKAVRHLKERALFSLEQWATAMGQRRFRRHRAPMLLRIRPAPVMAARRFALAHTRSAPPCSRNRWANG